jgi:hypothetical protein
LGIDENMPRRWIRRPGRRRGRARRLSPGADGRGARSLPGCGRKTTPCGRRREAPPHSKS